MKKSQAEEALRAEARGVAEAEEALREEAERLARADRDRSVVLFGHNIRELLNTIDSLVGKNPANRSHEAAAVRQSAAVETRAGVSPADARAAYFRVTDLLSPRRTMAPDKVANSVHRTDAFTARFDEAAPDSSDVWDVLDGQIPTELVEDAAAKAQERRPPAKVPVYGTYITTRVEAGGIPFGVLSVDAIRPGSLLQEDRLYVETIARILGISELLCLTTQAYQKAVDATRSRTAERDAARTLDASQGGTE